MLRKVGFAFAVLLVLGTVAQAATSIVVGNHDIVEGTANTIISINVVGGDLVAGLNFNAQIGDGGSDVGGTQDFGPLFVLTSISPSNTNPANTLMDGDIITGTPFGPNNTGQTDAGQFPRAMFVSTTTSSATVSANGLLARLFISTVGAAPGPYSLSLAGTANGDTDWAGSAPAPVIVNGTITVLAIPEPTSVVLALMGAMGMGLIVIRKRRACRAA